MTKREPDHACPTGCGRQVPSEWYACGLCMARLPWGLRVDVANAERPEERAVAERAALLWFESNPEMER